MPTGATPQERNPEEVARLATDFLLRREFGAFNKFYDNTLTGNTASVTIPIPSWVHTLYYEFNLRSDNVAAVQGGILQPNADGSASYDENYDGVSNGAQAQGSAGGGTSWTFAITVTGTGAASARVFGYNRGWIGDCQSTIQDKYIQAFLSVYNAGAYGANMTGRSLFGSWHPNPAVAIMSLYVAPVAGNLVVNSTLRCWGV